MLNLNTINGNVIQDKDIQFLLISGLMDTLTKSTGVPKQK